MSDSSSGQLKVIEGGDDYGAWLIIPTRSDGATINKSGWEIGGDSISRTTSSGSVEENPYIDIVSKLYINSDTIEIGIMLDDDRLVMENVVNGKSDGPKRTIRIPFTEITDVRQETITDDGWLGADVRESLGFAFETTDDVYKIKMQTSRLDDKGFLESLESAQGNWKFKNEEFISQVVSEIKENVEKNQDKKDDPEVDDSIADDLERLNKLRKNEVLSEEEFQKAKDRLLD